MSCFAFEGTDAASFRSYCTVRFVKFRTNKCEKEIPAVLNLTKCTVYLLEQLPNLNVIVTLLLKI